MTLFNWLRRKADTFVPMRPALSDDLGLRPAYSGEVVNTTSVLGLSAVWACVNLLAGTIGSLPLNVYRNDGDGGRTIAKDHPLYRLIHESPNADQTALDFWEYMSASIELRGNGYAQIDRSGSRIIALTPINPDNVGVRRLASGALEYTWTLDGRRRVSDERDILHIRGFGGSPLGGLSTITHARHSFGLAIAIDRAAGSTFENSMRPSGVLTFEKFLTEPQRKVVEDKLAEKFAGAINAGRPFVLEGGSKWEQLTINPEDAQMLQSRGFSVEDVCRWFGVPPFMVGHTEKSTSWGTGLEQQVLGFVKFTLRRRLKRIEAALERQCLSSEDIGNGVSIAFNLEGLLRGDSAGRARFYQQMTSIGAMTINEVRALENLAPVEGGDVPRMQMQNVPITEAGRQPASPSAVRRGDFPMQTKASGRSADQLTKDFSLQVKNLAEDGSFEGYGSIFGNVDSYGEKVLPGAFIESLARHKREGSNVLMLWQHNSDEPIGIWEDLAEDAKGLWGRGRLILEVQKAREVHALMKAKAIGGLSIGYREQDTDQEGNVRLLKKLDLYEISPVSFPANRRARIESVKSERMEDFARRLRDGDPMPVKEFEDILREAGVPKSMAVQIASVGYAKAIRRESDGDQANDMAAFLKAMRG